MANIITKRTQDDPLRVGGEPHGDQEGFFIMRDRGQFLGKHDEVVPVFINGHPRYAVMGQDNEMEKEFVDVLEQSASAAVEVPDVDERNPRMGSLGSRSEMKVEYIGDFKIRRNGKMVESVRSRETLTVPGGIHRRKRAGGPKKFQPVLPDDPAPAVSGEAPKED